MPTLTPTRRLVLILALLLLGTVAVYWPVAGHQYLSIDDHAYVADNRLVQAGLTWNGLVWAFSGAHVSNYHPLTWLSHMLDCQLFGPGPRAGHLVNLALHTVNSILLFLLLRWMTGREWCSAFVAAIFALHPQHVESVAWVSERKDVLSGLFWILTLAAWTWYVEAPRWWKYALTLLAFALGLLSKPMVVTLPCVLLLLDYWPLRRMKLLAADPETGYRRSIRFLIIEKFPFFALAGIGCGLTMWAQSAGGAVVTIEQIPLDWRIGNVIVSYLAYLRKFIWPSDLAIFYPLLRPEPVLKVLSALAVLVAMSAIVVIKGRSKPYLAVGWFWFLGMLVPVIGLVQVGNQAMADRYMYLPMIGLAVMLAWLAADIIRSPRSVAAACGFAGVALGALGIVTAYDVRAWRDSETVFTRAIQRTEPNTFAYHNLAAAKYLRGDFAAAIELFERCVEMQPANPHVRRAYAAALRAGQRDADAFRQLRRSIELNPTDGRTWAELGAYHAARKEWLKSSQAFGEAAYYRPDDFEIRLNLAVAHRQIGNKSEALNELQAALSLNPQIASTWSALGALLLEMDRPADAIEPFRRAAALAPNLVDAHYQLGVALMRAGRGDQAIAPLMTALSLDPKSAQVMTQLAWVLATHPDARLRRGEDAAFFANLAAQLTGSTSPQVLDALAAAQAELHQFDRAATTASRAAQLARDAGNTELATTIEQRLARYQSHQATRDATLAETGVTEVIP